jgi:hypothetical protein
MTEIKESYLSNPLIKKDGVSHNWTEHELIEYQKCMNDPAYFAENYIKIINLDKGLVNFKLYPYQRDMINHFNDNRFSVVLACRQSGKSISTLAYIMWYAIFHPEKNCAVLANKGATAREMLSRITLMLENLPFFLQPGCKSLNKGTIHFSNNSKIFAAATSGSSIRGMSCVPDYTRVCVLLDNDDIYYTSLEYANYINKNESKFIEEKHEMSQTKKYHFVYKTVNTVNGKEYIGYHGTDNLDDGYLGSGKLLKRAIEKYGPDSFTREILQFFDKPEDAFEYEKEIVNRDYVKREDTYNLSVGGNVCILYGEHNGFYGKKHSPETVSIIREKNQGKKHTDEAKEKISHASKANWENPEYRSKMIEKFTGRVFTEETKQKISKSHTGKVFSEETKAKISKAKTEFFANITEEEYSNWYNKTHGEEQRRKRSETLSGHVKSDEWVNKINRNPEKIRKTAEKHRGMKRSQEAKEKMSLAKKGKTPHNVGKIYIHNPITREKMLIDKNDIIPEGFKRGYMKSNENSQ